MAIVNQIVKELAGAEDLLLGQGTVAQTRAGTPVVISKLNAGNLPFTGEASTGNLVSVAAKLNSIDIAKAPTGNLIVPVVGGLVTLTVLQFANLSFDVTGVLTANATLVVPDGFPQAIIIDNATTGAFTLTVKHAATPGVLVKQGSRVLLYTTGVICEAIAQTAITLAVDVQNTPSGQIIETTVQGALDGLEARKLDVSAVTTQFTGAIVMAALGVVPTGYLECDGLAVNRVTYASLFSQIGIVYGAGNGATTFNVPDFRGEFLRGWDHGRGVDVGRGLGTAQAESFKAHTHVAAQWIGHNNMWIGGGSWGASNALAGVQAGVGVSGSTGGGETRPRNITVMYVIKT